ncbi:hypothetical protein ASD65_04110 [Microbacterium sp. Root61]|uniref:hypothetical protein n=1 Tax=Microbacterium sp. Root61 TaxID=1736570 RepID=UPI00070032E4|nr:hypothetical protein [Microbacterium sp. Root61]KRA23701.1 hypothetical protein ASD65_04110 [Microbacterium sp. Root61]
MSTKRLWAIAGAVAVLVAVLVIVANVFAPQPPEAEAEPTRTTSPTATPSASATPAPTYTPPAVVAATCENTSTAALRSAMASNGWISWETQDAEIGARPFDEFPNGSPEGAIVCRWGASPDLATDNIIDLAWAPIDPENAVAAMLKLEEQSFIRIETPDGVYMAVRSDAGWADDEGWGTTYYFGIEDVRWGMSKAEVDGYIKAPTDAD